MSEFSVARSRRIEATPERVHALINDFHGWVAWSPWQDLDPQMEQTYSGPDSGVGAQQAWRGNKQAGEGRMEITASSPHRIDVDLDFLKPFKASNKVRFDIAPVAGGATDVTWTMKGRQNPAAKLFFTLFGMEKKLGADFEKGLQRLKTAAEQ